MIERKGFDAKMAPNYTHLVMASNADWVVPASLRERRFFVIDVPDIRIQDHNYFADLDARWQSGGREAFLHLLLNLDLSGFQVRNVPQTDALLEQKKHSMSPVERWYYGALQSGDISNQGWPEWVSTEKLFDSLVQFCKTDNARVPSREAFGTRLSKLLPPLAGQTTRRRQRQTGPEKRAWGYELPPLQDARQHFDKTIGADLPWDEPGEVPPGPTASLF